MLLGGQRAKSAKLRGIKHGGGRFRTYPLLCYTLYEVLQEELCMNCSNFRFTLDMQSSQSQVSIPVTLGDTSRALYISFADGGSPYYISDDIVAQLSIKRPNGDVLSNYCQIVNNTTVKYNFTDNANTASMEGFHDCQVTLLHYIDEDLSEVIASPRFTMIVNARVVNSDDLNISEEDKSALDQILLAEAERKAAETARKAADAARQKELSDFMARVNSTISELTVAASVITTVTLLASRWTAASGYYYQTVSINGVTENSKVDLLPSIEQLAIFHEKDLAFVTENVGGTVTVYALGDKPANNYTMQVSITEVEHYE